MATGRPLSGGSWGRKGVKSSSETRTGRAGSAKSMRARGNSPVKVALARRTRPGALRVRAGEIVAAVQGSRAKPYRVTVRVRAYSGKEWERTLTALASQVGHLAALLDGEMPPGVADDLADAKIDLLPAAGEVQPRCSCPDWAEPCKHSAAVCYLVADSLDADPFLLFLMRGRDRDALLAGLRARRAAGVGGSAGLGRRGTQARRGADLDPEQPTSWGTDPGLNAQQAWARWAAVSAGGAPPMPAIPLPPPRQGRPTVLAVDPPAGSGITSTSLQRLAADAARRAWELAHGERSSG